MESTLIVPLLFVLRLILPLALLLVLGQLLQQHRTSLPRG